MSHSLQVASIVGPTEAEGPGQRLAIWVQGCPLRCAGCCNPEMLKTSGGTAMDTDELLAHALSLGDSIEGVTFLGGEPFGQAAALAALAAEVRSHGLSVMVFSGYTLAELEASEKPSTRELLGQCDLLVDGPYVASEPDCVRRWIGSRNQVMRFITDRYQPSDPRFVEDESFEIRYSAGAITVNGWPSSSEQVVSILRRQRRA